MDLTQAQIAEISEALEKLEQLDPAALPEPAAELASLLNAILEDSDDS